MEEPLPTGSKAETEPERRERSRSPSPDICAICLSPFNDRCYSNGCFHMFCFICLLEWSKVKLECPLCKQAFKEIYHKIKDYQTYDVHTVPPPAPPPQPSQTLPRFNFPLAQFADINWQTASEVRRLQAVQRLFSEYRRGQRSRINSTLPNSSLRSSTSANFRRYIYANELYCEGAYAPGGESRGRAISPRFFAEEPARCHRLVPWLNRELLAILPDQDNINQVIEIILEQIKHVDIRSTRFQTTLEPFTLRYTEHFVHELRMFAICPFDMSGFDRYAKYARAAPRQSALEQYHRPLLLTSGAQSETRPDLGQTRSRRSRWGSSASNDIATASTSNEPSVHRFTLDNLAGTSSAVELSISAVMNTADNATSSTTNGSSNSSQSAVTPTLSPSSSDSDIQVVSPHHPSTRSSLPTTSTNNTSTSSNPPTFSFYTTAFGNSTRSHVPMFSNNGSELPATSGNRPPTPILISDSDSSESSISITDSLMQCKGSAAMNTRRMRLSASSSCSSPEKKTVEGSLLDRCREPQLSDDERSSEQPSTSGLNRKRIHTETLKSSSSSECMVIYQSSNKNNQSGTSSSNKSTEKSNRKHHKHKKSKKSHKHSREDRSKHSSTESESSPHKHSKRHKYQKIKTSAVSESKSQRIPGIETFASQTEILNGFNGHASNPNGANTGLEAKGEQTLSPSFTMNGGESSHNGSHDTNELDVVGSGSNDDHNPEMNTKVDIREKVRLFTKRVIAPKYKDD